MLMKISKLALFSAVSSCALSGVALATTLGTVTVNGDHWAYSGSGQGAAANNTKATIGPFAGVAKTIHVTGTITTTNAATYPKSIRVAPSGAGLAVQQPW